MPLVQVDGVWMEPPGHEALWGWFSLSYASWLTLPRVLMHSMPDDWQRRMAALLKEYDDAWDFPDSHAYGTRVSLLRDGRYAKAPRWVVDYRHPDQQTISMLRRETMAQGECSTGNASSDNGSAASPSSTSSP